MDGARSRRCCPRRRRRVLDCGAGTGFLSLIAARLGHRVTALDLSPGMLAKLTAPRRWPKDLDIARSCGPAHEPPPGPAGPDDGAGFDAVIERHLLWTLPDPAAALAAWRAVAPVGRLVAIESVWGAADPLEMVRARAWKAVKRWRGTPPDHHGAYSAAVRGALPLGTGTHPRDVARLVAEAGWSAPRLVRLRDVEWASALEQRLPERLLGVTPRFAVVAT